MENYTAEKRGNKKVKAKKNFFIKTKKKNYKKYCKSIVAIFQMKKKVKKKLW